MGAPARENFMVCVCVCVNSAWGSQWGEPLSLMESFPSQGLGSSWSTSERSAYLNAVVVCLRGRHGLESTILVTDLCHQMVDNFLHLFHPLRNLLAPQVHLGMRGSAKQLRGPRHQDRGQDKSTGKLTSSSRQKSCLPGLQGS